MDRKFIDFRRRIFGAIDRAEMQRIFTETLEGMGIKHHSHHIVRVAGVGDHLVEGNIVYPEGWVDYYMDEGFAPHDPVVIASESGADPFFWQDLGSQHEGIQRRIMGEGRAAGICDGYTVPISGGGVFGMVSYVPNASSPEEAYKLLRYHQTSLDMMAMLFHGLISSMTVYDMLRGSIPDMSDIQRKILGWVCEGKTNSVIAEIENMTESQVKTQMKAIYKVLGVNTREQAVRMALTYGLVSSRPVPFIHPGEMN